MPRTPEEEGGQGCLPLVLAWLGLGALLGTGLYLGFIQALQALLVFLGGTALLLAYVNHALLPRDRPPILSLVLVWGTSLDTVALAFMGVMLWVAALVTALEG